MPLFLARCGGALAVGALFSLVSPLYARPGDPPATSTTKPNAVAAAAVTETAPPVLLPRLVAKASPYRPSASQAATITLTVAPAPGGAALPKDKDTELGVFYVRDDVGDLYWEQAKAGDDGSSYTNTISFPTGGEWRVFGEITPQGGNSVVTDPVKLTVDGARAVRAPLIPQVMPMQRVSGYTLTMKQPTRVVGGGEAQTLVFSLRDSHGDPVTDMDLWRGAIAHLILVDHDAKTLLHVIPDADDPRNGRTEYLVFPVRFPKDGVWRGWVVFQRGSQPVTIPFALRVSGR